MAKTVVTSQQVARKAGVSQSAVSRVFSSGGSASRKMTERVMKAADELGYRPNVIARSLITGQSKMIGLVVAYLENQFYSDALEKLSIALQAQGYQVLVFMSKRTNENAGQLLDELLDYQVDGIVMVSAAMSSDLAARCDKAGVPVVLLNRRQDDETLSAVTSNNVLGGKKVAQFLIAGGHQRIAHIAGWEGASTQRDRETGFLRELNASGRELFAREVGDYHYHSAQNATRAMFSKKHTPDAVFVGNDHMAIAAMDCIRYEFKLRIPQDVSIVGYDDVEQAGWPSFALTTIRQPSNRLVEETVKTLLDQIKVSDQPPRRIEIEGDLIVRSSARIPEGWKIQANETAHRADERELSTEASQ